MRAPRWMFTAFLVVAATAGVDLQTECSTKQICQVDDSTFAQEVRQIMSIPNDQGSDGDILNGINFCRTPGQSPGLPSPVIPTDFKGLISKDHVFITVDQANFGFLADQSVMIDSSIDAYNFRSDAIQLKSLNCQDCIVFFTMKRASLPQQDFWEDWMSSEFEIFLMDRDGNCVTDGHIEFDIQIPELQGRELQWFTPNSTISGQYDKVGRTENRGSWTHVEIDNVGGSYIATVDFNECGVNNGQGKDGTQFCDAATNKASCANNIGAPPTCACRGGYADQSGNGQVCELDLEAFDSLPRCHYTLTHEDRLNAGLRIRLIEFDEPSVAGAVSDLQVSGTYGSINGAFKALNMLQDDNTFWMSQCVVCNPLYTEDDTYDQTHIHASVSFSAPCHATSEIKIHMVDGHASERMVLTMRPESCPTCKPTQVWESDQVSGATLAFLLTCGQPNTFVFAELLATPTTGEWDDDVQYGRFRNGKVPNACHCMQACIDRVGLGCVSWRYQQDHKACYLLEEPLSDAPFKGNWKVPFAHRQAPGWVSDVLKLRVTDVQRSNLVVKEDREHFDLTLSGVGFPFNDEKSKDTSMGQHVKIVPEDSPCHSDIPSTVDGIGCLQSDHTQDSGYGTRTQTIYTLCTPTRSSASSRHVTFGSISIRRLPEEEQRLKVCYCSGRESQAVSKNGEPVPREGKAVSCFQPNQWSKVGPTITIPKAYSFQWASTPAAPIMRKEATSDTSRDLTITVSRPFGLSYTNPTNWRVKLVQKEYGCQVKQNPELVRCHESIDTDSDNSCWKGASTLDLSIEIPFVLTIGAQDVGDYLVCLKHDQTWVPISSEESLELTIHPIPEDDRFQSGPYHSQLFTAQIGNTVPLEVRGHAMNTASQSMVYVGNQCGVNTDLIHFGCSTTEALPGCANKDLTPPKVLLRNSWPGNGVTIGRGTGPNSLEYTRIQLTFDREITKGIKPLAVKTDDLTQTAYIQPEDMQVWGNKLVIDIGSIVNQLSNIYSHTYHLVAEPELVWSLEGVASQRIDTYEVYSFGVGDTVDHWQVLLSYGFKSDSSEFWLGFNDVATFSSWPMAKVKSCGKSGRCAPDSKAAVHHYKVSHNNNDFSIDLTDSANPSNLNLIPYEEGTRYSIQIEELSVDVEAVVGKHGFQIVNAIPVSRKSTDGAQVFDFTIDSDVTVGDSHTYKLCYCDSTADRTPEDLLKMEHSLPNFPSATYYAHIPDSKYRPEWRGDKCGGPRRMEATLLSFDADAQAAWTQNHDDNLCSNKCRLGCTGSNCFGCDEWNTDPDLDGWRADNALCLDNLRCRDLCDDNPNCVGFDIRGSFCWLDVDGDCEPSAERLTQYLDAAENDSEQVLAVDEKYDTYMKVLGSPCTQAEDYQEVGEVFVTSRADVKVEYVLGPNTKQSIEVTGHDLTFPIADEFIHDGKPSMGDDHDIGLSNDKIMVIDCQGTCGRSKPTKFVKDFETTQDWLKLHPVNYLSELGNNPPSDETVIYVQTDSSFCPGNVELDKTWVEINGIKTTLDSMSCKSRCGDADAHEDCKNEYNGYFAGVDNDDGAPTNALCVDRQTCEDLCTQLGPGCEGYEFHQSLNRCFLNPSQCVDDGSEDVPYNLYQKTTSEAQSRRLHPDALTNANYGFSWKNKLIFNDIEFTSSGEFKLCFCDSSAQFCNSHEDFRVEIGKVHVTGISCLLDEKHRRKSCAKHYYGENGLRCYDQDVPDVPSPPSTVHPQAILTDRLYQELNGSKSDNCDADDHGCNFLNKMGLYYAMD